MGTGGVSFAHAGVWMVADVVCRREPWHGRAGLCRDSEWVGQMVWFERPQKCVGPDWDVGGIPFGA